PSPCRRDGPSEIRSDGDRVDVVAGTWRMRPVGAFQRVIRGTGSRRLSSEYAYHSPCFRTPNRLPDVTHLRSPHAEPVTIPLITSVSSRLPRPDCPALVDRILVLRKTIVPHLVTQLDVDLLARPQLGMHKRRHLGDVVVVSHVRDIQPRVR